MISAYIPPPSAGTWKEANDMLAAKVRVLDCVSGSPPNGLGPDEFCAAGLPFADDRFECNTATGACRECWAGQPCEGLWSFCMNGMCDNPYDCWSGQLEDEHEGQPEEVYGLGTHTWNRTLHKEGSQVDEDSFHIAHDSSAPVPANSIYELTVHVKDLCDQFALEDEPMEGVEVRVQQQSGGNLFLEDLLDPVWQSPMTMSGLTVEMGAAEVVAFQSGKNLRISVRNPDLDSLVYTVTATLDYAGMMHGVFDPEGIPVDEQSEIEVDLELGRIESLVPQPGPMMLDGELMFLRPAADDPELLRSTRFELYSTHDELLRSAEVRDGGLALDLSDLSPRLAPFTAALYNDERPVRGRVYLCPETARDCGEYEPRRQRCGESCAEAWELCCLDDETGAATCADVENDPLNCGGCGRACEWDEVCLDGVCARGEGRSCWETECPDGMWCVSEHWFSRRDPQCVALNTDNENCGWLGHACPENKECRWGLCMPRSAEPCGADCDEGETCCWVLGSEQCIDTSSCGLNCGGCGHACALGEVCANGACAPWYDHVDPCPPGLTNCGRGGEIECVDLEGDVLHCGSCANQCSPEADCVDGVCVFPQGHHEVIYE